MELDQRYFLPVTRLYQSLTPGVMGLAIHNFVTNLSEPVVIGNDLLQLRLRRGADDFARMVTNTTFGIGGLIDLAKRQGLPHRDNDFGVTLGRLGVKPGAYLFLPLLGPSDARDAIGMGVDALMSPLTWVHFPGHFTVEVTTTVAGAIDSRSRSQDQLEAITCRRDRPLRHHPLRLPAIARGDDPRRGGGAGAAAARRAPRRPRTPGTGRLHRPRPRRRPPRSPRPTPSQPRRRSQRRAAWPPPPIRPTSPWPPPSPATAIPPQRRGWRASSNSADDAAHAATRPAPVPDRKARRPSHSARRAGRDRRSGAGAAPPSPTPRPTSRSPPTRTT